MRDPQIVHFFDWMRAARFYDSPSHLPPEIVVRLRAHFVLLLFLF